LYVSATSSRYRLAGEVATEDDNFGYEVVLDTIVKHSLQISERIRDIQMNVREEEEMNILQLFPNSNS